MLKRCASLRTCTFSRERKRRIKLLWSRWCIGEAAFVRYWDLVVLVDCLFRGIVKREMQPNR